MDTLSAVLLVLIALLVIYPMARTVIGLFSATSDSGDLGIDSSLLSVLWNTLVVVGGGSILALVCGATLAWINERTDGGFRGLGDFMPVAPLLLPAVTGVLGWVVLLDPRIGLLNVLIRTLLSYVGIDLADGPIDIYSMGGMVAITGLHLVPVVYLIVSAALRNLDPAIEEASRINGAGPLRTAVRVTLPAVAPALAGAWLLGIINGIGLFSVPVILGTNARIEVLSVRIWRYLTDYPSNPDAALVLAAGMLVVILALRTVQKYLVPSGRQATIGGRGVRATRMRLGPFRLLTRLLVAGYIAAAVVLPVLGLLLVSVEPFWSMKIRWGQLSLVNYQNVLGNTQTLRSLLTSLGLAAVCATVAMLVAGFLMLYAHQRRGTGGRRRGGKRRDGQESGHKRVIDFVTSLPATIPHSLIGVSFILAFSGKPFGLYGTVFILLLAYLTMEMPYAASAAGTATSVVGNELAEASRIFGASERRTVGRILLPLVLPGLAAGWVLVFIHILGEVTASSLLSGSSNPVVGRVLLDLWGQGNFPQMTALAIVIWLISSVFVLLMLRLSNRRFARATG
ncbi:ABC transporter permease [Streptomyces hyderabadensis]|uniref:Iron ABC transporter permease n=1 Tax=Streptomyces hyderabadensis TaxID=598549 RepID=A0ABP9IPL3_9ACTN|nr:iron ABC transporter permease [Streptomyces hyderabadensis]